MNDGKRGGRRTHPYSVERERERIRDWGANELKTVGSDAFASPKRLLYGDRPYEVPV